MENSEEEIEKENSEYFLFRESSAVQEFTVPREQGFIFLIFEVIPHWLAATLPLMCKSLVFVQFKSMAELVNASAIVEIFVAKYAAQWPSDKILFNGGRLPLPDLVLVSGSTDFLSNPSLLEYRAPTIVTHEFTKNSHFTNPHFKFVWYKHNLNGGCTNFRLKFGFRNTKALPRVGSAERSLCDFLDYLVHPTVSLRQCEFNPASDLIKNSCLTFRSLRNRLILPTYWFSSGWGYRKIVRKEH